MKKYRLLKEGEIREFGDQYKIAKLYWTDLSSNDPLIGTPLKKEYVGDWRRPTGERMDF